MGVAMTAATVRPVSIKIDEETKVRVQRLADARHRMSHWLMREAFRQDTLKAWEEYCTTGLLVTADEADAWLAQLEQGNDIEPPACHV